ncbi:MAG: HAMP domain-containing sensor histidine kinase [Candidatus Sumerlaeota bacterium]|nr:HAMP domain-containing sensor histidine kinase [Candidatus Sumerlaeota bacterium]
MKPGRAQIPLYILTAIALAFSLAILVWLHQRYASDRERALQDMCRFFTRDEVLRPPHDLNLRFDKIEDLARKSEETLFAERVFVTKMLDGGREHLVRPFYFAALNPGWKESLASWTRLPLTDERGETYGALYIKENRTTLMAVRGAIGGLGALLLLTLGLLTARLVWQQSELKGAYVALAEKDRQLVRHERLALVGQLSANILHELKKPVANIKQNMADLEMMLLDLAGSSPAVRSIKEQTELFFMILKDLGIEKMARSRDTEKEYADLYGILRQACALVQYENKAREIETIWDLDNSRPPLVLAPRYRLIQVFSNLILNAFQAMDGKGSLTLRARIETGKVICEVSDTGPGVAPEMRARLFEPFESTKPEDMGTGLGLYISRNIITELGGTLELAPAGPVKPGANDSGEKGIGARFIVVLPLVEGE